MPTEVIMPKVDMDMTHGTFAAWHIAEGAEVRQGDPLFDIETEKAAMEVEAPASGRLLHISAQPGDRIEVGTAIAWLYATGEADAPPPKSLPEIEQSSSLPLEGRAGMGAVQQTTDGPPPSSPPRKEEDRATKANSLGEAQTNPRATPAARTAARTAGLDLATIDGTGPQGRIQRDDVEALLRTPPPQSLATPAVWTPQSGSLSVTTRPGTGTPLLLLHGFTADSKSWAPLEKALGSTRPLIRIDLPGHGRSPRRQVDSFPALAKMLVQAFDDAVPDGEATHILAHSLGGALALALANIRPRQVRSLTLLSPAGLGPQIDADTLTGITRASHPASLAPWLRNLVADPATVSDAYAAAAFQSRSDSLLRAAQADMAQALFRDGTQTFDLRPALSRLTLPTQIVWGRQDRILSMQQALSARGEFALHLIEGAGHIPQYETPERIARIATRFMAGVEATSQG